MSLSQVSFAAVAQRLVCPPPPASANGSVLSLAAPAEPGVGVDTLRLYLAYDGVWWCCSAGGLTAYSCGRAAAIEAWKVEASQWIDGAAARLAGGGAS